MATNGFTCDQIGNAYECHSGELTPKCKSYWALLQTYGIDDCWVACPEFLSRYLDGLSRNGRFMMAKNLKQGIAKKTIQQRVLDVRRHKDVQVEDYVIHGWRYNAAVSLAEAGCSDSEIQAVTGHKTLEMVRKYRNQANQKQLTKRAQRRRK